MLEGVAENLELDDRLTLIFFGSVLASCFVSFMLRRFYLRAVHRGMRGSTPELVEEAAGSVGGAAPRLESRTDRLDQPLTVSHDAGRWYARAKDSRYFAARIYALAGCVHAAATTLILLSCKNLPWPDDYGLPFVLAVFVIFLSPVLWAVRVVTGTDWRRWLLWMAVYALVLTALAWSHVEDTAALWLGYVGVTGAVKVLLANRWLKAVGTTVLVFTVVLSVGYVAAPPVAEFISRALKPIFSTVDNLEYVAAPSVLLLSLFVACLSVLWMGWRHVAKKASDQSIVLDTHWLLFAEWTALFSYAALDAPLGKSLALLVVPTGLNWLVTYLSFRPWYEARLQRCNVRLLLLRVFKQPGGGERLLSELGVRWRYAGSIQLIAAPDVAAATLEVDEFIDFVTGHLGDHFVKNEVELARRLDKLDLLPDLDGRFRVNEFFCAGEVWRKTVTALFNKSDAVLVDLRGLLRPAETGRDKRGVVFELRQLVNLFSTGKLVLLVDRTTDKDYLQKVFDDAWGEMKDTSPNSAPGTPAPRVLEVVRQGPGEVRALVYVLLEAARHPTRDESRDGQS